jgi:hypothetical protein
MRKSDQIHLDLVTETLVMDTLRTRKEICATENICRSSM